MLNDNLIISIDWLQLYCKSTNVIACSKYEFRLANFQTKQFRTLYEVYYRNEEFASIQAVPVSQIIPADCVIVKFKNRQLYGSNIIDNVRIFLDDCNLQYQSITRLDLAVDFNKFFQGLLPHTFIRKFIENEFLKVGQGKYTLIGEQKHTHTFDYLRFGSKTSSCNVYLYNKTKELNQVQDKPYIRKKWMVQGLDLTKDVWRLEISIKSEGLEVISFETGEHFRIHYSQLSDNNYLSNVFFSYINHYFRFVINDGQKNKSRMSPVVLFQKMYGEFKPLYLPKEHGANRSDKIFVKKLYQLDSELRDLNDEQLSAIHETLSTFVRKNCLGTYVAKNLVKWSRVAVKPN